MGNFVTAKVGKPRCGVHQKPEDWPRHFLEQPGSASSAPELAAGCFANPQ
jgi:hypothetical protein